MSRRGWWSRWLSRYRRRRASNTALRLVTLLDTRDIILDVGAGDGLVADRLTEYLTCRTISIDIKGFGRSRSPKIMGDAQQLPFTEGTVDVVLFLCVLHHSEDPVVLLREGRRVARRCLIVQEDLYGLGFKDHLVYAADRVASHAGGWRAPSPPRRPNDWLRVFRRADLQTSTVITDRWSVGPIRNGGTIVWTLV